MLKTLLCIGIMACVPLTLCAQSPLRGEVFGGYSYLQAEDSLSERVNQNGWELSAAAQVTKSFSLVADFSNHYGSIQHNFTPIGTSGKGFTFLFGPRYSYTKVPRITPYAQALFGGLHWGQVLSAGAGSGQCGAIFCVQPSTGFAWAFGGGLDVKATDHVGLRLFQMDYLKGNMGNRSQNDLRVSTGIVFRFGNRK